MERSGNEEYIFVEGLVRLLRPKNVLEIGTSGGHAALSLATAMQGGIVTTIDIADLRIKQLLEYSGLTKIEFHLGESSYFLEEYVRNNKRFDLVFIDGDHHYNQVYTDWVFAKQLSDTILLHDALQFNGVRRVIKKIRLDPEWDVSVLSYPGSALWDDLTGKEFYSNRCPGIAIATRKISPHEKSFSTFVEHPSANSRRAFQRRKEFFLGWHAEANRGQDLSFADWEMIFHTLWNLKPDAIVHLGHIGSGATLLFMEFTKSHQARFFGIDPTGKFWPNKKAELPTALTDITSATVFAGVPHAKKALSFIQNHQKVLLWVDEFHDDSLYGKPLQQLLALLPNGSLACIRNFSPYNGSPERVVVAEAECTNPRAYGFCDWLKKQPYSIRLASPESTFRDYVNAGHWLIINPGVSKNAI